MKHSRGEVAGAVHMPCLSVHILFVCPLHQAAAAWRRKLVADGSESPLRVRVWRVLYEVDDKEKVVRVFRVRHRCEAYKH